MGTEPCGAHDGCECWECERRRLIAEVARLRAENWKLAEDLAGHAAHAAILKRTIERLKEAARGDGEE